MRGTYLGFRVVRGALEGEQLVVATNGSGQPLSNGFLWPRSAQQATLGCIYALKRGGECFKSSTHRICHRTNQAFSDTIKEA